MVLTHSRIMGNGYHAGSESSYALTLKTIFCSWIQKIRNCKLWAAKTDRTLKGHWIKWIDYYIYIIMTTTKAMPTTQHRHWLHDCRMWAYVSTPLTRISIRFGSIVSVCETQVYQSSRVEKSVRMWKKKKATKVVVEIIIIIRSNSLCGAYLRRIIIKINYSAAKKSH